MNGNFHIERRRHLEGENTGSIDPHTYHLSMTESRGADIEWSFSGIRSRKRHRAFSGDIWVMPPGQSWWTRHETPKSCIHLLLSSEWLQQITHPEFALTPQIQLRDALLAQMIRTLADTANRPETPTSRLYQESLVTTLALHLATHYGHTSEHPRETAPLSAVRLRAISEYVSEHLSETISLNDLAQLAGLSASQFSLRFRETTGQTPHQYVTSLRVERARELLVSGQHTPADVATLTGFADQSHLTRHVRRALGVTPGALTK
jgi:AraC family transcriptional regulator